MAYAVPKDYTWEIKIASYDAGRDRRLRPSNQLKLQQEVGELQLSMGRLGLPSLLPPRDGVCAYPYPDGDPPGASAGRAGAAAYLASGFPGGPVFPLLSVPGRGRAAPYRERVRLCSVGCGNHKVLRASPLTGSGWTVRPDASTDAPIPPS